MPILENTEKFDFRVAIILDVSKKEEFLRELRNFLAERATGNPDNFGLFY